MKKAEMKEVATKIIEEGWANNLDEDDIKMNMFTAKIPFGKLNGLFKSISIELGLMADPKEVTDGLKGVLEGFGETIELIDWAAVEKTVDHMVSQVEGATPQRALSLLKAYCRDNEIEFPKKPSGGGGGGPRAGKLANAIVALVNGNADATKADAYAVIFPLVGGEMKHKNALYYVNSTFAYCLAVKQGVDLATVVTNLKNQPDPEAPDTPETPATEDGELPDEDDGEEPEL